MVDDQAQMRLSAVNRSMAVAHVFVGHSVGGVGQQRPDRRGPVRASRTARSPTLNSSGGSRIHESDHITVIYPVIH